MSGKGRELVVALVGDASRFTKVMDSSAAQTKTWHDKIRTIATGVGTAVSGIGVAAFHMGEKLEDATVQSKVAVENAGKSWGEYKKKFEDAERAQERFGHQAGDTEAALTTLTAATNDPNKALGDMALVSDLAARKHITLADAAGIVAKAHAGNVKVLKEFGISGLKGQEALDALSGKLKGSASAAADTFHGKVEAMRAKVLDLAAHLGQKLGPALTAAGPLVAGLGGVMQSGLLPALGGAIVKVAVWSASTIASAVSAAAGWVASMAAMTASAIAAGVAMVLPFLPVILTIGAVGAAAYLLWRNWSTIWDGIKAVTGAVVGWIGDRIGNIIHFFEGIGGKIADATHGMWDGIKNGFRAVLNWIIGAWDSLHFKVPSFDTHIPGVGKIGGFDFGVPQIPKFGNGGPINGLGIVGDKGPELFAGTGTIIPNHALGGTTVNVYANAVVSEAGLADLVESALARKLQRSGSLAFQS